MILRTLKQKDAFGKKSEYLKIAFDKRILDFVYTENLNIKNTIKAVDDPEAFADTEFKIRNLTFQQKKAESLRQGKGLIKITQQQFERFFESPPPGADVGKLKKVANEVENLEYVTIRGKT